MKKLNHKLDRSQLLKIEEDAYALFFGERTGHVGYLQYGSSDFEGDKVCGSDLWTKFRNEESYYLAREDDELIKTVTSLLPAMDLDIQTLIDLGPGDRNALLSKTIPLLKACGAKKYIGVDMADIYARDAARFVAESCKIKATASVANFLEESLHVKENKAFLFMGGSTISNIPVDIGVKEVILHLSAQLAKFRACVDDQSYMLIGFDCNQYEESLNDGYQTDLHARLIENILWHIARDTDISFNPNCFEYQGEWIAKEHRYAHSAFVKKSCVVQLGEEEIQLHRGDVLHLDNSYKFPVEMLEKAASNAGWNVINTWTQTGRAHYALLSTQTKSD